MVRLKDGLTVLWREHGVAQIGMDPRCGLVVPGLSKAEQELLDLLPGEPSMADLERAGAEGAVSAERVRSLVSSLVDGGVLLPDVAPRPRPGHAAASAVAPDAAYWGRLRADGDGWTVLAHRSSRTVGVLGTGRLGMLVASGLAAAGVGAVLLSDDAPVLPHDVGPGAFHPADVGRRREEAGTAVLRAVSPHVRTSAPAGTRPDLCVLVEHGVASPVRTRPLVREDLVHLSVVVGDVDVVVGPLVVPGQGPCLRCLDLHRCDVDDRWPVIATQVAAHPPAGVEGCAAALAAAICVGEALAHLDGRRTVTRRGTLEVSGADPVPRLREWQVHPACGCVAPGEPDTAATGDAASS